MDEQIKLPPFEIPDKVRRMLDAEIKACEQKNGVRFKPEVLDLLIDIQEDDIRKTTLGLWKDTDAKEREDELKDTAQSFLEIFRMYPMHLASDVFAGTPSKPPAERKTNKRWPYRYPQTLVKWRLLLGLVLRVRMHCNRIPWKLLAQAWNKTVPHYRMSPKVMKAIYHRILWQEDVRVLLTLGSVSILPQLGSDKVPANARIVQINNPSDALLLQSEERGKPVFVEIPTIRLKRGIRRHFYTFLGVDLGAWDESNPKPLHPNKPIRIPDDRLLAYAKRFKPMAERGELREWGVYPLTIEIFEEIIREHQRRERRVL
jgi:hypothetical protein